MAYATPEKKRAYDVKWKLENPDKVRANAVRHRARHREELNAEARFRNKTDQQRANQRRYKSKLRLEIFTHYGLVCACCKDTNIEFLAIDHIEGGGGKHRRDLGIRGGSPFYRWLKSNGFPEGFRTLCHNCNQSMGAYGYCPHNK